MRHAARANADERDLVEAAIAFEDFVGDARQRAGHAVGVHYLRHGHLSRQLSSHTSSRPHRAALKSQPDAITAAISLLSCQLSPSLLGTLLVHVADS